MSERIAFLGWGSLLWTGSFASPAEEERQLAFDLHHDAWQSGGPSLRLEFSRVSTSRDGALTLVIDRDNGALVPVAWCRSRRSTIDAAIDDLCRREATSERYIGVYTRAGRRNFCDADAFEEIRRWALERDLSSVVWSDLRANFQEVVGRPFSPAAAAAYVRGLADPGRRRALEYLRRAPRFVRTPLRDHLERMTLAD